MKLYKCRYVMLQVNLKLCMLPLSFTTLYSSLHNILPLWFFFQFHLFNLKINSFPFCHIFASTIPCYTDVCDAFQITSSDEMFFRRSYDLYPLSKGNYCLSNINNSIGFILKKIILFSFGEIALLCNTITYNFCCNILITNNKVV